MSPVGGVCVCVLGGGSILNQYIHTLYLSLFHLISLNMFGVSVCEGIAKVNKIRGFSNIRVKLYFGRSERSLTYFAIFLLVFKCSFGIPLALSPFFSSIVPPQPPLSLAVSHSLWAVP